jgi:hypothetical protein
MCIIFYTLSFRVWRVTQGETHLPGIEEKTTAKNVKKSA